MRAKCSWKWQLVYISGLDKYFVERICQQSVNQILPKRTYKALNFVLSGEKWSGYDKLNCFATFLPMQSINNDIYLEMLHPFLMDKGVN